MLSSIAPAIERRVRRDLQPDDCADQPERILIAVQEQGGVGTYAVQTFRSGHSVPAHGWYLVARSAYNGPMAADQNLAVQPFRKRSHVYLVNIAAQTGKCPFLPLVIDNVDRGLRPSRERLPAAQARRILAGTLWTAITTRTTFYTKQSRRPGTASLVRNPAAVVARGHGDMQIKSCVVVSLQYSFIKSLDCRQFAASSSGGGTDSRLCCSRSMEDRNETASIA